MCGGAQDKERLKLGEMLLLLLLLQCLSASAVCPPKGGICRVQAAVQVAPIVDQGW